MGWSEGGALWSRMRGEWSSVGWEGGVGSCGEGWGGLRWFLGLLMQSLNTQEAYVTSHMKAIVRRDHELLGDRAGDERPFSSVEDAVKRLLPYHIYHEEDTPPEMEKKCK